MNESVHKTTKRHLMISSILAVVSLVAIVIFHLVLENLKTDVITLNKELEQITGSDVSVLRRTVRSYEAHGDVLGDVLIEQDRALGLLEEIQSLALRNGLASEVKTIGLYDITTRGERIDVSGGASDPARRSHGEFHFTFETTGTLPATLSFLKLLETMPRALELRSVVMSVVETNNVTRQWRTRFNVVATTL